MMSAAGEGADVSAAEQLMAEVVDTELCVQCGTCVGGCPGGALSMTGANPLPTLVNPGACLDCGICLKVCPRRTTDFDKISRNVFGRAPTNSEPAGVVESFWVGRVADEVVRSRAAGGGIVSGLVIHLLSSGKVDGVIMCGPDPHQPGHIVTKTITTRAEMIANAGSHYRLVPVNAILRELAPESARFALVGTGCHIAAVRKLQMANPRWACRIILTIGIECGMNLSPSWTRYLMSEMGIEDPDEVETMWYRAPGGAGPGLVLKSGEKRELEEVFGFSMSRLAPLFMPLGCSLCLDYYAEHADVTVGDHAQGISEAYVRSPAGREALKGAVRQGVLDLRPVDVEKGHELTPYIRLKMRRCQTLLESRSRDGLPVPDYRGRERLADDLWDFAEDKESFLFVRRALREPTIQAWYKKLSPWRQYRIGRLWMGAPTWFQPEEGWHHPQQFIDEEGWEVFLASGIA